MLPALYQLADEYAALLSKLEGLDIDEQTIADTIESTGLQDSIHEKAHNIVLVSRSIGAHNDAIKAEIDRLGDLLKARQTRQTALEHYLLESMQRAGIEKIDGPLCSIAVVNNPESVDVFQPELVPNEYMRQPKIPDPMPDKTAIKQALKAGKDVGGCSLAQSKRLRIT